MTNEGTSRFPRYPPQIDKGTNGARALSLFRVFDSLDQRDVLRAVLLADRPGGVVERLLVGLDELHAGGLELLRGLRDHLVPQPPLLRLSLARDLPEQVLIRLGERVPGALGEHQDLGDDEVAGQAVDLAYLVVILREQGRRIVLSAVHHAGLKRGEELVEAHRDAVAA